ncbi:hypothetical protein B0H19DRAFT_1136752 [Mycena capillaripes]|nr:hypothetical protein B0H19DRAFT_1136752 [Mycena capillaripes]
MLRTQQYIYVAWVATPTTILPWNYWCGETLGRRRTPMSPNAIPTPFPMSGRYQPVSHAAALAFAKLIMAFTRIGPISWLVSSMTCALI